MTKPTDEVLAFGETLGFWLNSKLGNHSLHTQPVSCELRSAVWPFVVSPVDSRVRLSGLWTVVLSNAGTTAYDN